MLSKVNTQAAVQKLQAGELILYPTETLFGIGADASNSKAIEKIYQLKKRDFQKPIIVLVAGITMLKQYFAEPNAIEKKLIEQYWPGPLTLLLTPKPIFPMQLCRGEVPSHVDYGRGHLAPTEKLGVRISSHPSVQKLFENFDKPLTSTSANLSNQAPAKNEKELENYFGKYHLPLLSGAVPSTSKGSTVVEVKNGEVFIHRQGDLVL